MQYIQFNSHFTVRFQEFTKGFSFVICKFMFCRAKVWKVVDFTIMRSNVLYVSIFVRGTQIN